jgi:argininosuccinate synthase
VGGKETLTSHLGLPETAWPTPVTKSKPETIRLRFEKGECTAINEKEFEHPVAAIEFLQQIAQPFGIGRDIHVGDTIIGIKGRVGFEAAAPMILIKAHHLLEKHTLTKWQLNWKEQLAQFYGNWLHEGQMLDPVMRDIETFFTSTQKTVSGTVTVLLHPYRFELVGVESAHDLMSSKFGTYGEMNNAWTGDDVKGFTKIVGNQTSIFHQVNHMSNEKN